MDRWPGAAVRKQTHAAAKPRVAVEDYEDLYQVAEDLGIGEFEIAVAGDRLQITGAATYQLQKDQLWDAVKSHDGWQRDVVLEISVARSDIRGIHTVARGETMRSIARRYLGKASRDVDIFEANRDRLNDPDQIFPGQQLVIPRR